MRYCVVLGVGWVVLVNVNCEFNVKVAFNRKSSLICFPLAWYHIRYFNVYYNSINFTEIKYKNDKRRRKRNSF